MKTNKKIEYISMDNEAYLSGSYGIVAGIYLKTIEHDVNDYAIIIFESYAHNYTNDPYFGKSVHRLKINYETKTPYIRFLGYRLKMNDFIKCN